MDRIGEEEAAMDYVIKDDLNNAARVDDLVAVNRFLEVGDEDDTDEDKV